MPNLSENFYRTTKKKSLKQIKQKVQSPKTFIHLVHRQYNASFLIAERQRSYYRSAIYERRLVAVLT